MKPLSIKRAARRARRGFTLIEVMVSVILFSMAAVSSLELIAWGVRANGMSNRSTEAINAAQDKMEELLAVAPDDLEDGSDQWDAYTRAWEAHELQSHTVVQVTVSWNDTEGFGHDVEISNIVRPEPES